jgi:hypothetical protein
VAVAATAVVLTRPGTFTPVVFVPGDEVPDWAVEMITNPEVLVSAPVAEPKKNVAPTPAPARRTRKPKS